MKKLILSLLFSALLITFFGCSNPAGGDDNGTNTGAGTSSAATWQIQNGFVNSSTWEFSENQTQGFSAGSKITLANPNFTKITNMKCYVKEDSSWVQYEDESPYYTIGPTDTLGITDTNIRIINNTVIITTSNPSSLTETASSQAKFIFTFDDNSNLIYFW